MSTLISPIDSHVPPNYILDVKRVLTGEQFEQLCRDNRDMRLELTSKAELIIMPPTGSKSGRRNFEVSGQFANWVKANGTGVGFDSSTGFVLPDGARLSPDVAWIKLERWVALTEDEQEGFAPLCPDFVIEIRSRSDNLPPLQDKMVEYIQNGAQMSWLIDPLKRRVYIYRSDQSVKLLEDPVTVSGDEVLPGFELDVAVLW